MAAKKPVDKIEKYFCNPCGHKTKHFVRGEYSLTEHDEHEVVSFTQRCLIVECCGCENLALIKKTHFSEDEDYAQDPRTGEWELLPRWEEAIYPPVTYRNPPPWFGDLPDEILLKVSGEIYKSLQSESYFLATFGSRTLLDRLILLTVGDQKNFQDGLKALLDEEKISASEMEILNSVIQAGHAAAHRGWAPSKDQLFTILDTVEGLIHRLLVLPKLSEELDESVPTRGGAAKVGGVKQVATTLEKIEKAPRTLRATYEKLAEILKGMGEDVSVHPQKHYIAFRRNRNFASVQIYNQKKVIRAYLNLNPDELEIDESYMRDVRQVGHFGTGDLEVTIRTNRDIERCVELLKASYEAS
ncbi:DUF5655 domain-containing protein [Thalassospiraceae bacterium LMO-JJ14]|nr:DUF5655 domain-containing protein [Thalassospiraceae bacterium LMO-JJ14]